MISLLENAQVGNYCHEDDKSTAIFRLYQQFHDILLNYSSFIFHEA